MIQKILGIQPMVDPDCRSTKITYKCKKATSSIPLELCPKGKVVWEYYVDVNDSTMVCDIYESSHCCDW